MVAVHRGGHGRLVPPRLHELEQRHLGRRVLHRDAIGAQQQVAAAGRELLALGIVEMSQQDLLGVGQRPLETTPDDLQPAGDVGVGLPDEGGGGFDRRHRSLQRVGGDAKVAQAPTLSGAANARARRTDARPSVSPCGSRRRSGSRSHRGRCRADPPARAAGPGRRRARPRTAPRRGSSHRSRCRPARVRTPPRERGERRRRPDPRVACSSPERRLRTSTSTWTPQGGSRSRNATRHARARSASWPGRQAQRPPGRSPRRSAGSRRRPGADPPAR